MASPIRIDDLVTLGMSSDATLTPPPLASLLVVTAQDGDIGASYATTNIKWDGVNADTVYSRGVPGQHSNCGIFIFKFPNIGTDLNLHAYDHNMLAAYWIGGADTVNPIGDEFDDAYDANVHLTVTHAVAKGCLAIYVGSKSDSGVSIINCTQDAVNTGFYTGVSGHEQQGFPGDVTSDAYIVGSNNVAGVGISITNKAGGGKLVSVW